MDHDPASGTPEAQSSFVTTPSPQIGADLRAGPVAGLTFDAGTWTVGGAPLSSAGTRFGAYLLDVVLLIVTLAVGWLIWSLIIWSKGQSPGKALLGMRCVRTDTGRTATWGTMAVREIVGKGVIGTLTFGVTTIVSCFMILGATHQGVWDKMATTTVVDDPDGRFLHQR